MVQAQRLLFLVPAHNEELLVGACVDSLLLMDSSRTRAEVIVIADNCVDDTVARAERPKVQVWPRTDAVKRGKSEALGWAIRRIDLTQWDAIVIVDADSTVDPLFATALAELGPLENQVAQAYFGSSNEFETWLTRLSGVLTRIRYEITYPRKQAKGLNVPLTGNGMCIGARLLEAEGWHADSITEDWELYARWTAAGIRINYARNARLFSQEAGSLKQGSTQRERWASGRAEVLRKWRRPLLHSTEIGLRQKVDALSALGAPSPVVGALLATAVAVVGLLFLPKPYSVITAVASLATLLPWLISIIRVLWKHPQRLRTVLSFAMLPPYAIWRAGLQIRAMLVGTKGGWVRTARR